MHTLDSFKEKICFIILYDRVYVCMCLYVCMCIELVPDRSQKSVESLGLELEMAVRHCVGAED